MWTKKSAPRTAIMAGLALAMVILASPATAAAQQRIAPAAGSDLLRSSSIRGQNPEFTSTPGQPAPPAPRTPTHRTEGAIIGGVLLGGAALVLGLVWDDPDSGGSINVPVATLTGAALGAVMGAMIGGLFPREPHPSGGSDSTSVAQ